MDLPKIQPLATCGEILISESPSVCPSSSLLQLELYTSGLVNALSSFLSIEFALRSEVRGRRLARDSEGTFDRGSLLRTLVCYLSSCPFAISGPSTTPFANTPAKISARSSHKFVRKYCRKDDHKITVFLCFISITIWCRHPSPQALHHSLLFQDIFSQVSKLPDTTITDRICDKADQATLTSIAEDFVSRPSMGAIPKRLLNKSMGRLLAEEAKPDFEFLKTAWPYGFIDAKLLLLEVDLTSYRRRHADIADIGFGEPGLLDLCTPAST